MYTVVSAFGIKKTQGSRWGSVSHSGVPVSQLFSDYRTIYLTLSAPFLQSNIFVDMEVFRVQYSSFSSDISAMLLANGNNTIPTISSIPTPDIKRASFADAFNAGYKINIIGRNIAQDANVPRTEKIDLVLSRPETNMRDVYDYCLFTVNGFFHLGDTDGEKVYILDGGKSSLKSRQNQIGIWSFKNIGKLSYVPIKTNMIYNQGSSSTFLDRVYIKVNQETENKSVFMILGGYLVRPEKDIFFPVGNNTYCLVLSRLPLLQRFYESNNYIDYSSLGLDYSSNNQTQVNINQFYSNNTMTKLLTLSTSFMVILDKPDLVFIQHPVRNRKLPNRFTTYVEPKELLITGCGKVSEYHASLYDKEWTLTVQNSFYQNRVFNTALGGDLEMVSDSKVPDFISFNSAGYLLEALTDF